MSKQYNSKEEFLKELFRENKIDYPKKLTKEEINTLYSLWVDNKLLDKDLTELESLYAGLYCQIKNDNTVALEYYFSALDLGNYLAAYLIAKIYDNDKSILNDSKELNDTILKYYKLAADHGIVEAQTTLGLFYQHILNDDKNAVKYYKMAIKNNDATAMYLYAKYLYDNKKNYTEMVKLLNKSGKLGNGDAYALLALYFQNIESDSKKIVKTFKMGTSLGSDKAYLNLGNYYYEQGKYDLAEENYKAAIALLNVNAMNNLGQYYLSIDNESEGLKYIKMASKLGNIEANKLLMEYYRIKGDEKLAKQYENVANSVNNLKIKNQIEYDVQINKENIKFGNKNTIELLLKKLIFLSLVYYLTSGIIVSSWLTALYYGYIDDQSAKGNVAYITRLLVFYYDSLGGIVNLYYDLFIDKPYELLSDWGKTLYNNYN